MKRVVLTEIAAVLIILAGYRFSNIPGSARTDAVRPVKNQPVAKVRNEMTFPASPAPPAMVGPEMVTPSTVGGVTATELLEHPLEASFPKELVLTPEERDRLLAIFALYEQKKARLEAGMIEVVKVSAAELHIRIPPYVDAGARLRQEFYGALEEAMGPEKYPEVYSALQPFFDDYFRGFGAAQQGYEIKPDYPEQGLYFIRWYAEGLPGLGFSHQRVAGDFRAYREGSFNLSLVQMEGGELSHLPTVISKYYPWRR